MRCSTLRRLRSDVAAVPNRLRVEARRSIRANRRCRVRSVVSLPSKTRRVDRRPHVAVNDVEIARSPSSNVGIVFSPGGFLVSYYLGNSHSNVIEGRRSETLGVIECLTELKLFHKDTPISGTSAGALAGAFAVSGVSPRDCSELTRQIQGRLLHSGYGWKVTTILYETLEVSITFEGGAPSTVIQEMLPHDVHRRATDRIGIGVTIYTPKKGISGKVLTQYASRKEFIDAVVASCYIPYYLGPRLGVEWEDGSIYSDGMPTHFFPDFPLDGSLASDHTITVESHRVTQERLMYV